MERRDAPHDLRAACASACVALKLFPLPGVVLLPGAPTPFHLFEPRYRALAAAALAGDGVICVPTLVDPAEAMAPRAAVRPVAGAGVVVADQRNQDGTIDIVLTGALRVRLVEELERGAPYREFRAEPLHDVYPDGGAAALELEAEALARLCWELAAVLPEESGARPLAEAVARTRLPGAAADLVAAAAIPEPEARYRVLEALDVRKRLEIVTAEVAGTVLLFSQGKTPQA